MTFGRRDIEAQALRRAAQKAANLSVLCQPSRALTGGSYGGSTGGSRPKEGALQHQGYMAAVRDLGYCMRCRKSCRPQFCHADMGKGMGIKTDVREGWPGCDECHRLVGSTGYYPREVKRAIEQGLAVRTRHAVKAAGTWPARLPEWPEENAMPAPRPAAGNPGRTEMLKTALPEASSDPAPADTAAQPSA